MSKRTQKPEELELLENVIEESEDMEVLEEKKKMSMKEMEVDSEEEMEDEEDEMNEAAYQSDMDENKPVVAVGVKGMNSKPFKKKFKNYADYEKWIDSDASDDYEIKKVMNEAAYQSDMDENKPVVAVGVKGMNSKPFKKKFKDYAAFEKWIDSDVSADYEVEKVMNEEIEESFEDQPDKEDVMEVVKVDMSEDIAALTEGEDLSEEFKLKAQTIFEAAVSEKVERIVEEKVAELESIFEKNLEEEVASFESELLESMDKFLNYAASEWMENNKLAVEKGIRSEIVENFIGGMKSLFEENYVNIPEEKVELVDELFAKVESLEEELKQKTEKIVDLHEKVSSMKRSQVIEEETRGLPVVQADKLRKLAEGVEYQNIGELKRKLEILKESYTKRAQGQEVQEKDSPIYESGDKVLVEENDNNVDEYDYVQRQYTKYLRKPNNI